MSASAGLAGRGLVGIVRRRAAAAGGGKKRGVVGVVRLPPLPPRILRLHQFAVEDDFHGRLGAQGPQIIDICGTRPESITF